MRPFFSRRIDLNNSVRAGARLSGNLGNNWRINLMDIQTGEKENIHASNYLVAALQRSVFSRSNISAFFINKQVMDVKGDTSFSGNRSNRVAGLEYNLASPDNRWTGKAFYRQSLTNNATFEDAAFAANITFSSQYLTATINQSLVGEGYIAETGYIRRRGYYEINPIFQYKFFPESNTIINHGPAVKMDMFFNPSLSLTDRETQLLYRIEWKNNSITSVDVKETFIKLQAPYDPTNTGGLQFNTNEDFHWNEIGGSYSSDPRKLFNVSLTSRYGGYYTGSRLTLNGELNYRIQPYGSLALVTAYNYISLPSPYNSARLLLVGPRLDFTFTDKLFFTSFIQYNNQIDNLHLKRSFQRSLLGYQEAAGLNPVHTRGYRYHSIILP